MQSIDKSRKTTFARLILSLGIKYVGAGIAELLAKRAEDFEALAKMSFEELIDIEGIGEKVAESLVSYFKNPEHIKEIHRLFHLGVLIEKSKVQKDHLFAEKTFVLTGSLQKWSRSEASSLIKERGGNVSNSVSKKTDYVLVGEEPGSKYEKAKELGIKILSEEEFFSLL